MSKFDLENYETVDERIHKFWEMYPDGSIQTDLFSEIRSDNRLEWICKTTICKQAGGVVVATGWATEYEGANKFAPTNAPELAETSSIGRALANLAFAKVGKRASKEEVASARSKEETPKPVQQDDPWAKGMEILGDALGAEPLANQTTYTCSHGVMVFKTGISKKTNKPWAGYFCPDNVQLCDTKWQKVG
jgi:hypothetical protein